MKYNPSNAKKMRCTIMLDEDIATKIRKIQSAMIRDTSSSVSFSSTINMILRKGL